MEIELVTMRLPEHLLAATKGDAAPAREPVLSTAELAECTCPDFCERDHANE